jgi:hypothetical protein
MALSAPGGVKISAQAATAAGTNATQTASLAKYLINLLVFFILMTTFGSFRSASPCPLARSPKQDTHKDEPSA